MSLSPSLASHLLAEEAEQRKLASVSHTLRSHTRPTGPQVRAGGSLHHIYTPTSPRAKAAAIEEDEVLHDLCDVGLSPTVVFHNLTPSELYEKARGEGVPAKSTARCNCGQELPNKVVGRHAGLAALQLWMAEVGREGELAGQCLQLPCQLMCVGVGMRPDGALPCATAAEWQSGKNRL